MSRNARRQTIMKWGGLVILSLALAIIIIDTTLLNVSFGYLIRDLNTDIQSLQWVITAYSLTLAAFTITGGRLGDLFGRKRMFLLGAVIFAIGSLIASNSHQVSTMIWGESIIEGIGAALMMPATSSLLVSTFQGRERAIAMGVWGGIAAAASAVGPILGGYLTTHYSWRWGFRINVAVAAIILIGSFLIKEYRDREEKPSLDWVGVLLSSTGLLALVFGIIESSTYGWWKAKEVFHIAGQAIEFGNVSIVVPSLVMAAILLVAFVLWELRVAKQGMTPLVSMKLFANRQFTSGAMTTTIMSLGQAGLVFSIPIFFQAVRGLDAYHTGLAMLPASITALLVAPFSAAVLTKRIAPKYLVQAGLLSFVVSVLWMQRSLSVATTVDDLRWAFVLYGLGIGLVMAQVSNLTLSAVSVEEAGEASGVSNTLRQIGSSFGSAIIGAVLLTALSTNLANGVQNSTIIPTSMKATIAAAVSSQTSNVEFGGGARLDQQVPPVITAEITAISHQATVKANKQALQYAAIFSFLGFLVAFLLPKQKDVERSTSVAATH